MVFAGVIFLITYLVIVSERVHRTLAALLGGMAMILFGVVSQNDAFGAIDLNVIFLLAGMMMIAYVMGKSGIFQWMAIQAVRLGRGNTVYIMIILAVITALGSALLDNVTIVVLLAPVTLYVATTLNVNPVPLLIAEVMASNIGGSATLIGDPPNILIGSAANISFDAFVLNMGPPALFGLIGGLIVLVLLFRNQLQAPNDRQRVLMDLNTEGLIHDRRLLLQALIVLALVLVGFVFHSWLHIEPATVALTGAVLLLIWTRQDPVKVLEHVEWTTLFFFVGLFITVEAIVQAGIIARVADGLIEITGGDLRVTTYLILWFSALASGIVDNIPYTAAMIPVVEGLAGTMRLEPIWWALALGADFGGNLTLVGASANIVVASLAERSGHKLNFGEFFRYGFRIVLTTLSLASLWLWWRYLL